MSRMTTLDFITILVWGLIILLTIIVISNYLDYRKTSKKIEKPQQTINTIEQMKKPKEEKVQDFFEVRYKVDKIIAEKYKL